MLPELDPPEVEPPVTGLSMLDPDEPPVEPGPVEPDPVPIEPELPPGEVELAPLEPEEPPRIVGSIVPVVPLGLVPVEPPLLPLPPLV